MNIIEKIADRIVDNNDEDWNMNIRHFDWVPGVGVYGIYQVYEKTKRKKYLEFLVNWADKFLDCAYEKQTVNSTAPLLTIVELYKITEQEKYLKVCIDIADYIITKAPLTREGGLEHTVTEAGEGFSEQIWADTLFMVCIFLTKLGQITQQKYIDFAINQLKIHHKVLFDKNEHLYYHGWNCAAQNHMSGIYWGRANAWVIFSSMEILNTVGAFDGREEIEDYIKKHIIALKLLQCKDGGFRTILNDDTSYEEISATAGIAAGIKMAVKAGIVDDSYIDMYEKAIKCIRNSVMQDGSVGNVSTGTPVMTNADAYKAIPICPTLYGQGLAILALCQ